MLTESDSEQPVDGIIPDTPLTTVPVQKRSSEPEMTASVSKKRKGGRPTGPQSVADMAGALRDMASSLNTSSATGPSTPQRRTAAVRAVTLDNNFEDYERSRFIRLIAKDIALADMYMAIPDVDIRSDVVRGELESHNLANSFGQLYLSF